MITGGTAAVGVAVAVVVAVAAAAAVEVVVGRKPALRCTNSPLRRRHKLPANSSDGGGGCGCAVCSPGAVPETAAAEMRREVWGSAGKRREVWGSVCRRGLMTQCLFS